MMSIHITETVVRWRRIAGRGIADLGRIVRLPGALPAPLSWRMLANSRTAAVQRAMLMGYFNQRRPLWQLFRLCFALLLWPVKTVLDAWRLTKQVGGTATRISSRAAQFAEQLWLAWIHGISPTSYYLLGIASATGRPDPAAWLQNGHAGLLNRALGNGYPRTEADDKLVFARVMERSGIPAPMTLAVFEDGRLSGGASDDHCIERFESLGAIFTKPVTSAGGRDCVGWERRVDGRWVCLSEHVSAERLRLPLGESAHGDHDTRSLIAVLARWSRIAPLLVQPWLRNHPELPTLGGRGLVALRLVTGLGSAGTEILRAVLCLPTAGGLVSQNGPGAAIDIETGAIGWLYASSVDQRPLHAFTSDGKLFKGLRVPHWHSVVGMVRRGHAALPDFSFLGWDACVTPDGPMILETNLNFGTVGSQKPGSRPLIDEAFLSIFKFRAARSGTMVAGSR